ncbi:MAG: FG-GAP-like repeat-containing protein [bacterium]|nr:FG-GAP-like repeat-containing protein [bacterium]
MKRSCLSLTILSAFLMAWLPSLNANVFTEINSGLAALKYSYAAWGDYDNDGDLDLALAGNYMNTKVTKIYRNDGSDRFTDIGANIIGVQYPGLSWGDYDRDGDLDLALCGESDLGRVTKIYRNNSGSFVDINANFTNVTRGVVAWADYNRDGYLDLLVSGARDGTNYAWTNASIVYHNNAGASFTKKTNLAGVVDGSAAWADYNNDDNMDLVIAGSKWGGVSGPGTNVIYTYNNAANGFVKKTNLVKLFNNASTVWGDYDGDGDLDLAVAGMTNSLGRVTRIYAFQNNGFVIKTNLLGFQYTSLAWGDYDNDGDLDLIASGDPTGFDKTNVLYQNTGGGFSDSGERFTGTTTGCLAWGDYDNDNDLDLLITGNSAEGNVTKIYKNEGTVRFTNTLKFPGLRSCDIAWGDFNNDSRLDLSMTGQRSGGNGTNVLYLNKGISFVKRTNFTSIQDGSCAWGDFDNDGDLDLAAAGFLNSGIAGVTGIYTNGRTRWALKTNLQGVISGCLAWGDYDNDGDLDLLATGATNDSCTNVALIYQNNAGCFTVRTNLVGGFYSSAAWGDYDNDGDLDLVIAGRTLSGVTTTKIYNNQNGAFSEINTSIIPVYYCSVAWGDYDNDNDLDLAVAGASTAGYITKIYRNDGAGNFVDISAGLTGVFMCSLAWGDFDNDNDLDLAVAGDNGAVLATTIYRNDGSGKFTDIGAGLTGVKRCKVAWGDYDNDGFIDLIVAGQPFTAASQTNIIYRNQVFNMARNRLPNDVTYISAISNCGETVPGNNQYQFRYRMKDHESDSGKIVKVRYSVDRKKWMDASVSGELDSLTTSTQGVSHAFIWNAAALSEDIIGGQNVFLRVLAASYFGTGSPVKSAGPLLYGSTVYQLSVPIRVDGTPQCRITSPVSVDEPYDKLSGTISIYGYAYDDNFNKYELYYGSGVNPSAWTRFMTGYTKKPPFEQLGSWDTSAMANGVYSLKVAVYDNSGKTRDSWTNMNNRVRVNLVNVPPAVSVVDATYPTNNHEDVALNSPIIVHFSDKLNPNTITASSIRVYDGVNYITGLIKYNDFCQSLIFTPDQNWTANKDFVFFIDSGIQNIYGVALGREFSYKFKTTVYLPEKVSSVDPASARSDAALDTGIRVFYSDGSLSGSAFSNGMEVVPIIGTNIPECGFAGYSNNFMARYTNRAALRDNMIYIVNLKPGILDQGYYTWYFTTLDNTTPEINWTATEPGRDATFVSLDQKIRIAFTKPMNDNTLNDDTMYLEKDGTRVNCRITYSEAYQEAYLTPLEALDQFTLYSVSVSSNIKDFGGKALAQDYQWSFRTAVIVDKDGGRVATSDGKMSLVIGPHALADSTTVQITKLDCSGVPAVDKAGCTLVCGCIYRFDPIGTKLKKKITVSLAYSDTDITGLDENKLAVYIYRNGQWERIGGTVDKANNKVDGVIDEFNVVALVEDKNVYTGVLDKVLVDCQPRVFKPSEWETARISFELPKSVKYSVMVYNMAGKLVDVLAENTEGVSGQNVICWDGKNLKGKSMANNMYMIALILDDNGRKVKKTKTIVILEK